MQHKINRLSFISRIETGLKESPIVALLGARQVGKTTLAGWIGERWKGVTSVFDLERAAGRAALEKTPELTLGECEGLVVIDEVQRMPELFQTLRPLCDDPKRRATFLLLGSASPVLVRGVSESLAGRVQFVPVPGLALEEVGEDHQDLLWWRGGFPRAYLADSDAAAGRWWEGFRRTFLERDIPNLGVRVPSLTLERFWNMLAHFHGEVWNAADIARSMSVTPGAVNHYRDLLAGTFMIRVLSPWHENMGKRQVKSPKIYFRDSGLYHYTLGLTDMPALRAHPRYGASWEGFALEQVLTLLGERESYFWATARGAELDLLLIRNGRRWGFEFKCADAPSVTRSMHIARKDLSLEHLWVIYPGNEKYALGDRLTALPLKRLAEVPPAVLGSQAGAVVGEEK